MIYEISSQEYADINNQIENPGVFFGYAENEKFYFDLSTLQSFDFQPAIKAAYNQTITEFLSGKKLKPKKKKKVEIVADSPRQPFAAKILNDGRKIFKRVHGVVKTIQANSTDTISIETPYEAAKITGVEIIGASIGDTANFNVYDNSVGTISGYPNVKINQFGFNVVLAEKLHREQSDYDADVIQGLKLEAEITNSTSESKVYGVNFIIHEIKA